MSLRLGIDLDGTLADLSTVFHRYEEALFGTPSADSQVPDDGVDAVENEDQGRAARAHYRQQQAIWQAIKDTENFWTQLPPLEPGIVAELYRTAMARNWEVFFITQRPQTRGASVQKQTQDWLAAQGFAMPSVLTLSGSRGKAAHALDLDFLIDDLPKNCVDVVSDSRCRPILMVKDPESTAAVSAKRMNIGVVTSFADAIALLSQPTEPARESTVRKVMKALGITR